MKRIKTGVEGFDKLVQGGFPQGSIILISGGAGTGKSTFAIHYAHAGAENNEKTLFFTTEESEEMIIQQAKQFNIDLKKDEKSKKLRVISLNPEEGCMINKIKEECKKFGPKRVVIDSVTTLLDSYSMVLPKKYETILSQKGIRDLNAIFSHFISTPYTVVEDTVIPLPLNDKLINKFILMRLFKTLRDTKASVLITSELLEDSKSLSRDSFSEFMVDGVILLYFTGIAGESSRNLQIRKMRLTQHEKAFFSFDIIRGKGIVVNTEKGRSLLLK